MFGGWLARGSSVKVIFRRRGATEGSGVGGGGDVQYSRNNLRVDFLGGKILKF